MPYPIKKPAREWCAWRNKNKRHLKINHINYLVKLANSWKKIQSENKNLQLNTVTFPSLKKMLFIHKLLLKHNEYNNNNNNNNNNNKHHGLWNPEDQCRINKGPPKISTLSRINPIPRIDTYFFKIYSNIVL